MSVITSLDRKAAKRYKKIFFYMWNKKHSGPEF